MFTLPGFNRGAEEKFEKVEAISFQDLKFAVCIFCSIASI